MILEGALEARSKDLRNYRLNYIEKPRTAHHGRLSHNLKI